MTRETVACETPASSATSRLVTIGAILPRLVVSSCGVPGTLWAFRLANSRAARHAPAPWPAGGGCRVQLAYRAVVGSYSALSPWRSRTRGAPSPGTRVRQRW